jgi:hypothetical protein
MELWDLGRGRIRVCLGLHDAVSIDSVESGGWSWGGKRNWGNAL